ncbi:MAG TPA: hypothetical protein VMZ03_09995 [Chitinophagaceae bacterium]|nr:hypothetical protein [Chitinophagaceae bacterium]
MKPAIVKNPNLLLALFALILTAGLVSWDHKQSPGRYEGSQNDTIPNKKLSDKDKKVRDLDDVIDELNAADFSVDMEKLRKELEETFKGFDGEKLKLDIEKAMKDVDFEKLKIDLQESLGKVDWDKMKMDLDKVKIELSESLKDLDLSKMQKELQESLAKVDWDKIKVDMDKVKDVDMKKLEEEMKKLRDEMKDLGPKMEKELANAKVEIEKAKADLKEFKNFVDGLENDGLINKKENYNLKHKDGELFINGKKASEQVYNKYRNFLEKHKKFNIQKEDDDFDMDLD